MKHPDRGITVTISTPHCNLPEFQTNHTSTASHCLIPSAPTAAWFFTVTLEPVSTSTDKATHYILEFAANARYIIKRPMWKPYCRSFFDPHSCAEEQEPYLPRFYCPLPGEDVLSPRGWFIKMKVWTGTQNYQPRVVPKSSPNAAKEIMQWKSIGRKSRAQRVDCKDSILFKFEHRCPDMIPGCPQWNDIPKWYEEGSEDCEMYGSDPPIPHHECEQEGDVNAEYRIDYEGRPHPPSYYRGPRLKNPQPWDLKIREIYIKYVLFRHVDWVRIRSPLVDFPEKDPQALQRHKGPRIRPNIPKFPAKRQKPLPFGWEIRYTPTWQPYFVNHKQEYTTWTDPRGQIDLQRLRYRNLVIRTNKVAKISTDRRLVGIKANALARGRLQGCIGGRTARISFSPPPPAEGESQWLIRIKKRARIVRAQIEQEIQMCWLRERDRWPVKQVYLEHWFPGTFGGIMEGGRPVDILVKRHRLAVSVLKFFEGRENGEEERRRASIEEMRKVAACLRGVMGLDNNALE